MNDQPSPRNPKPKPPQKPLPVIYPDADPHNANWLRILAQQAKDKQKETPR